MTGVSGEIVSTLMPAMPGTIYMELEGPNIVLNIRTTPIDGSWAELGITVDLFDFVQGLTALFPDHFPPVPEGDSNAENND